MQLRPIQIKGKLSSVAKALYISAFPKEERLPWFVLRLQALRRGIELTAWMDGDTFCGFTSAVTLEGMHFVLFLAIAPSARGKGYGSAILTHLSNAHQCVVLNIEPLDPQADNYPQRLQRMAFYQKNGFYDTGWYVWEVGGKFRVLSTEETLDEARYRRIFRKLTLGIWNVKLLYTADQ